MHPSNLSITEDRPPQNFTCCNFKLAGEKYSLPIESMVEISDLPPVVDLPLSPSYVHGMVNLRGKVMPVIDMAAVTGKSSMFDAQRWMVVVEADSEEYAFLCDGVPSLAEVSCGELIDPVEIMNRYRIGAH